MNETKSIAEVIERDGVYAGGVRGVSMRPMLREGRDTVVITPVSSRPQKYDVILFRRADGCVLHRVVKVLPEAFVTCGDSCSSKEQVRDGDVVGVLSEFYRGERRRVPSSGFWAVYGRAAVLLMPLRIGVRRSARALSRLFKRRK